MIFFGKPVPIPRFLGRVDLDDPTNLPSGPAAECRNTDFTRDSPGITSANLRCGNNQTMQGLNKVPITGIQEFTYEPELATEDFFQMPLLFDWAGMLQREFPVGSGHMKAIPAGLFTPPANSHMISCQAGNKVWSAYSDLTRATSGLSCFDPKTLALNPFGMKPFGWRWEANTKVIRGEMCTPPTPANGNGHTYQAQNDGVTGANAPNFPTGEASTVNDNGIVWKELTMVLANRLPDPDAPALNLNVGGTFAAGLDVYVKITFDNSLGETTPSVASAVTTVAGGSSVVVLVPALASLAGWIRGLAPAYVPTSANVYVAVVATGSPAPATSTYEKYSSGTALGVPVTITAAGTGSAPPTKCTARITPGQLPTPDVEPDITRDGSSGAFPAGRDVYVRMSYTNNVGETKVGPASSIINTNANDGIQVTVTVPEDDNGEALYSILSVGIYEADVATGTPAPAADEYSLVGYYQAGATPIITNTATGANPPTSNTTGPGGAIVADSSTGGTNGGQGYRYGAVIFVNQNQTYSGFTQGSVVKTIIDEDGWEIGAFNVATGPANIVGRIVLFTVADGTQAGPFFWNGNINLLVPSQNLVYPNTFVSDDIAMTATVFLDNVTTQGTFNFTDEYLQSDNSATDRLRLMAPPQAIRVDYLESIDRLALTGVAGYMSGVVISLGGDYESFYASTSPVPVAPNGERSWGCTDKYKGIPFVIREKSGYALSPNNGDPASYGARKRWDKVGACGPRAWDACAKFIAFVDETGLFKYDETDPDLLSKEIPRGWGRINWQAKEVICCTIDEDTQTIRLQVPTGDSLVPNEEICMSYLEGWGDPLHFSTYSQKEIGMDAARRYSFNDFAAFVCIRMRRTIPNPPPFEESESYTPRQDSSFYVSQLLYGSSGFDGVVNARTPGVYNDNGAGIDWQYETMAVSAMQSTCKPEGFNLNANGNGTIYASFIAGRDQVTGELQNKVELKCREIALTPGQRIGITRKVPPKINEFWRIRFTNGKQPDVWASLKSMTVFIIPWSAGRGALDR